MQSKELVIDEAGDGQCIKGLHEEFIRFLVILVDTLSSEVEKLSHLPALVVAPQHVNGGWIIQLERIQEQHDFAGEGTPVDVVSQEKILGLGRVTPYIKHLHKVIILSMNVTNYSNRIIQTQQIRLLFYKNVILILCM